MLLLFLDESGDHNLDVIDPQYPLFVLGGCIIDNDYHEKVITPNLKEYNLDLFGRDDFIMHTADIVRRRDVFQKLTNKQFRERFYKETNLLMDKLEYTIVACVIKKNEHLSRYGLSAIDPYMLALKLLAERFVYEVRNKYDGIQSHIIAESRDETLNNQLRLAWMELRISGTGYLTASEIRKYLAPDIHIYDKKKDIAGLQIADLIVSAHRAPYFGKEAHTRLEYHRKQVQT